MGNYQIDDVDRRILSFLVKDARMAYLEIARECGVSGAAIHQRVRKLEANGVITGSRLLVKPSALGLNVCAFVSISISEANKYLEVTESLKKIPEVVECHFVTGSSSMLIKLFLKELDLIFLLMPTTDTMISLDEAFERQVWVKDYKSTSFR